MEKKRRGILQFVKIGLLAVMAMLFASSNAQAVDFEFHGQYRVIYFMDMGGPDNSDADNRYAVHRFRPLFKSSEGPWTGTVQLNYGWFNDTDDDPEIDVRLAYMTYTFENGITLLTGKFGIGDHFDNLLFDACCLIKFATAFLGKSGNMKWRVGSAKLSEGETYNTKAGDSYNDDVDAIIFDVDTEMGNAKVGASYYMLTYGEDAGDATTSLYGVRVDTTMGAVSINADFMGSSWETPGGVTDGGGIGFHLELGMPVGDKTANVMILYSSGDDAGEGFGTAPISGSYWGYTAILGGNLGGGSDIAGSAGDYHNGFGNGGLGLLSIQARIKGQFTETISGLVALAMYTSNEERNGANDIGMGLTAQGERKLEGPFSVSFGVDSSTIGEAHPNNAGDSFSVTSAWVRLQGAW